MSFSRAKLQRFNEIPKGTPSSTVSNPIKKTGSVISTTEKISDNISIISNDSSCFRTPTLIRKKKPTFLTSTKSNITKLSKPNDSEILQEKIVECNNKDAYIKDLTEQIEDLKTQLANLKKQKTQLDLEKDKYETKLTEAKVNHKTEMDNVITTHNTKMRSLKISLKQRSFELATLKEEHIAVKDEQQLVLETLLKDLNELGESFNVKVTQVYEEEIKSREDDLARLNERLATIQRENGEEIKNINKRHKEEISKIEVEMLLTITDIEKKLEEQKKTHKERMSEIEYEKNLEINNLKLMHSQQIASLIKQKDNDIKQLEDEYKTMKEEIKLTSRKQLDELDTVWKERLKDQENKANEALQIYQQESESKIIEIELEKNRLKQQLSKQQELQELRNESDIAEKCKQLQTSYDEQITNLKSRCNELLLTKITLENELKKEQSATHTYQITLQKTRETVDAISKRLLNSDQEVEKLKKELSTYEAEKLNLEAECNTYQDEIEILMKHNMEMEERQEKATEIYKKELLTVKNELKKKTTEYKNLLDASIKKNENILEQKQSELKVTSEQLDYQQIRNIEAQQSIKNANQKIAILETTNGNLKEELDELRKDLEGKRESVAKLNSEKQVCAEQLEKEVRTNEQLRQELSNIKQNGGENLKDKLKVLQAAYESLHQSSEYYKTIVEEYEREIEDTKKVQKSYNEQCKKYEDLQKKYEIIEEQKNKLLNTVEKYNCLIGPYREQLEAFERERKCLLMQKCDAEVEAELMGKKYAEILGHQNQKQKVKHMVALKDKNTEMARANKSLEAKVRAQAKTIEHLKKELSAHVKTNRMLNATDKENLSDFLSPLRDRN